jgi:Toprim domain
VPIEREIERRGIKLNGGRIERCGPCPRCEGNDRFSINVKKRVFNCRQCGAKGDVIDLVRFLDGCDFIAAGTTLTGEPPPKGNGKDRGAEPKKIIAAAFAYENEDGSPAFVVERVEFQNANGTYVETKEGKRKKTFRQRRPDHDKLDQWLWNVDGVPPLVYRLPQLIEAVANEHIVIIVEGEAKADLLWSWNIPATCCAGGAKKWRAEHSAFLRGADVVILPDNDDAGRQHAEAVAASLQDVGASVRILDLPGLAEKEDIIDWVAAGGTVETLHALIERSAKPCVHMPCAIEETLAVFDRWLLLPNPTPVYAVLGTVAANLLPGDPVWLGIIGPPSSAKTEILNSISSLPHVVQAATLTPAGLLSGTSKKQYDKTAKGGLLRQIGDFGIIALKDFGSILSMRPDAKAEVLAALREVYDGAWTRHLGTDGGRTLSWRGKVALLFGATGVIDSHYSVIGAMGDRFLLSRLAPVETGQFGQALKHMGAATEQMRKELAEAVARLFAGRRPEPRPISNEEIEHIDRAIMLVVRLRGAVERDRHSREMEAVYGAEGTARIGLALERLLAGLDTLGVDRADALAVVEAVAMDSVPPIRRRAYEYLRSLDGGFAETAAVANALGLPTNTVRRALEDLMAYQLVARTAQGKGNPDIWRIRE